MIDKKYNFKLKNNLNLANRREIYFSLFRYEYFCFCMVLRRLWEIIRKRILVYGISNFFVLLLHVAFLFHLFILFCISFFNRIVHCFPSLFCQFVFEKLIWTRLTVRTVNVLKKAINYSYLLLICKLPSR